MAHDTQTIAKLAYQLWEARGRHGGSPEEDWRQAEEQLAARQSSSVDEASQESFPASDAPASHLPDVPPVNAADKWDAAPADTAVAPGKAAAAPRKRAAPKSSVPKPAAAAKPPAPAKPPAAAKPPAPAQPTTAVKPASPRGPAR